MTITKKGPLAAAAATAGFALVLVVNTVQGGATKLGGGGAAPGSRSGTAGSSGQPTAAGATSTASGTATGALEQYGYGELAVVAQVSSGKIVGVKVTHLLTADQYSQQIAQQVIPMLKNEVLQAQSAQISSVSGATYTSEAYATSLQSALGKLHVK